MAIIYIQIIILSFAISLHTLCICTNLHHSGLLGQILLYSSQVTLSLDCLYHFSVCIIPLSKLVCQTRSDIAHKLKPGSSVKYFISILFLQVLSARMVSLYSRSSGLNKIYESWC